MLPLTTAGSPGAVSKCAMHGSRFPESSSFIQAIAEALNQPGRATNCQCPNHCTSTTGRQGCKPSIQRSMDIKERLDIYLLRIPDHK